VVSYWGAEDVFPIREDFKEKPLKTRKKFAVPCLLGYEIAVLSGGCLEPESCQTTLINQLFHRRIK
jgi:hypothetical protein